MVVTVHYLAEAKDGPIQSRRKTVSQSGSEVVISKGGRYAVACQPDRKHLAVVRNKRVVDYFVASGDHRVVTCPKCKGSLVYQQACGGQ